MRIVVAVRDVVANQFSNPWFVPTQSYGVRVFADEIRRAEGDNPLSRHPEDFELYLLGSFNEEDASFVMLERPQQISHGKDFVVQT